MTIKFEIFFSKLKTFIHYSLVCCPTLLVNVSNVLSHNQDGLYIFNGTRNKRDYWIQLNGDFVMWYQEAKFNPYWVIGKLDGSNEDIQTLPVLGKDPSLCPNDENNHWAMNMLESEEDTPSQYQNSYTWVSINESMKCKGKQSY